MQCICWLFTVTNCGSSNDFRAVTYNNLKKIFFFLSISLYFLFLSWSLHKYAYICVLFRCTPTNRTLWADRGFIQCTAAVSLGSRTWQPYRTCTTEPFYTTCSSATHRTVYMWASTHQNHTHIHHHIFCSSSMDCHKWLCVCECVNVSAVVKDILVKDTGLLCRWLDGFLLLNVSVKVKYICLITRPSPFRSFFILPLWAFTHNSVLCSSLGLVQLCSVCVCAFVRTLSGCGLCQKQLV